ncbi:hypothetical protein [Vibrio coralliirubri]|uniref:hypothetical protein n=2 Tax=Vibrio coralliirubri TaxID=1516159 RepID=UPI000A38EBFF|nr:hypothetical protein [Vibrio coralliirubri]
MVGMEMKKIKILFYIEHIERELSTVESIVDGLKLKERDYVIVSTNFAMGLSKFLYIPELVITPWLYSDYCYKKIASFIFTNEIKILNLHHEQITNLDRISALLPSGKAKEGYHISWGCDFQRKLIDVGVDNQKIHVTGSIRLSKKEPLYSKKDLSCKYLGEDSLSNMKWVMFVSSYSWKDLPESVIKKVEKNGRKNVWEYRDIVRSSYNYTLSWIERFLIENNDVVYIYRLHPSENIDEKLLALKTKHSNFHIVSELKISEWIPHCDILDLWISTSVAEIFIHDKPVRIIRPIELPYNVEVEGFQRFEHTNSVNSFLNVDFSCLNYNKIHAKEYLDMYYTFGIDSKEETILAVEKILGEKGNEIYISKLNRFLVATLEVVKDFTKISLVKTGLIKLTPFNRIKKSFFLMCNVDDL